MIRLDGRMRSDLNWSDALDQLEKGMHYEWMLDLGLFEAGGKPLSNQMQFMSLKLSLEHFVEKVWNVIGSDCKGLCLYDGPLIFAENQESIQPLLGYPEDVCKALNARDIAADYLNLLTGPLPDDLRVFIRLNTDLVEDLTLKMLLLSQEPFERLEIVANPNPFPQSATHAFCLPSLQLTTFAELKEAVDAMERMNVPWRSIPESRLTLDWDGLDTLYVLEGAISSEGRRKIQGFVAAGGEVVNL
jgi:hypothetical protein